MFHSSYQQRNPTHESGWYFNHYLCRHHCFIQIPPTTVGGLFISSSVVMKLPPTAVSGMPKGAVQTTTNCRCCDAEGLGQCCVHSRRCRRRVECYTGRQSLVSIVFSK